MLNRRKALQMLGSFAVSVAFVLCAALSTAAQPPSAQSKRNETEAELKSLAQDAVQTQNDILVSGDIERSLGKRPKANLFRQGIAGQFESLVRRKKVLSETKADYKSHRTELTFNTIDVKGDRASINATEYVVLALDPQIGGPKQTEYVQEHVFEFQRENGIWKLTSDVIPPPPSQAEPETPPVFGPPLEDAPKDYQPPIGKTVGFESMLVRTSYAPARSVAYSSYNGTSAALYAYTYWGPYSSNYNPNYRVYSNDCTNFVSQAMKYAGWPYDTYGDRTLNNTWYYGLFSSTTSYSWAGANNFFWFFNQSGRGYYARYFQDMLRGDVLQADWGPTPDGVINHSMIVTKKDSYGTIYLTYHTNNTKDRSIKDIAAQNPGTNFYGERMYSSF